MNSRSPELRFTEAEKRDPVVGRAVSRVEKARRKLDKAEAKIPKKAVKTCTVDVETGIVIPRLSFEEKNPPASRLTCAARAGPGLAVSGAAHRKIREAEDENVGVESAHRAEEAVEGGTRALSAAWHEHRLCPYRNAAYAEAHADRANLSALRKTAARQTPELSGNPLSRMQQRRYIKKQYAAAKRAGADVVNASEIAGKATEKAAVAGKKVGTIVRMHKKGILVVGLLAALLVMLMNLMSSCSVLAESGLGAVGISTYPVSDSDMLAAEAQYASMEAELQSYLDNYESTHSYDEYHYDLDEIEHDPYVLTSMLTAWRQGGWTIEEVQDALQMFFDKQYILTETVTAVTKYDSDGEPYDYYICSVKLENFNLSHVPVYIMSQDQLSMYAMYMATLGNRADLFPTSSYIGRYGTDSYQRYEIPPEALADETFAAMIAEAEKYLGYPYVWGGSNPSTSFDCSGFVSWVINQSGWSVGRLTAQGLYDICTPVSDPKPGDLVFFQGTYDTVGMSHVGIYVGNMTMIHCGDPISYTNLNSSYWQAHLAAYGRLP